MKWPEVQKLGINWPKVQVWVAGFHPLLKLRKPSVAHHLLWPIR
jgi:hypothetical protein